MAPKAPNRIAELRKARNLTLEQLAERVGTSNQQISMLERGERRLTVDWMERLAKPLGVEPAELLLRKGTIQSPLNPKQRSQPLHEDDSRLFEIDELDVKAQAGGGAMVESENRLVSWSIPRDVVRARTASPSNDLKIITIEGDSMEPTLWPGQKVMVDTGALVPSPPGLFVVWDGLGQVVKRIEVVPHTDPVKVKIKSDNPHYETYDRVLGEAHIRGRVIGFWRWT